VEQPSSSVPSSSEYSPEPATASRRASHLKVVRAVCAVFAIPYALAVNQLVLMPTIPTFNHVRPYNVVPFHSILSIISSDNSFAYKAYQLAGNLLLLAPLGALAGLWSRRLPAWFGIVIGFAVSGAIEAHQYLAYTWRIADIDDVLLNTLGCAIAFAMTRWFLRRRWT